MFKISSRSSEPPDRVGAFILTSYNAGMDQARGLLEDADEYVNSVMGSHGSAVLLRTPLPSGRKRCLSAPDGESEIQKPRNGYDKSGNRQVIKARRNLFKLRQ